MKYKVCKKNSEGKFRGCGYLETKDQYGRVSLCLAADILTAEALKGAKVYGKWAYFSVFEDTPYEEPKRPERREDEDEVPF
jgi:hypothetical protein